jgi:hypothetical protein
LLPGLSNAQQKLISLADRPDFVAARCAILLDEDLLHSRLLQCIEQFFPIRCSLAEWGVLGKFARDGGRKTRGPFLHMREFESLPGLIPRRLRRSLMG